MMAFTRLLAMALLASTAWTSHPSESARNQYEAREDSPQTPQLLAEATDRPQKSALPDLQVGCADGHIQETQHPSETAKISRRKRSYSPWSGQVAYSVPYPSIAIWKPPVYQLSRPYYIPIFGVHGRPPIFFPPQPLLINPGVPRDNPVKPFQGPEYLPPRPPGPEYLPPATTESPTTIKIMDKFNGGDNSDDRPIWDISDNDVTPRPTTETIPTRRPRPPGAPTTHPPLVHSPTGNEASAPTEDAINEIFRPPQPVTTPRPRPSRPNEPSRCVWAIISCCSTPGQISYDCFEQLGCPGAFWDNNPCDNEFAKAAIAAALNYYESK